MRNKYKICVYAICKNEIKFIERWYKSMSEADYIAVLDTGSTDGSFEKLNELGAITEQKVISPWRFDVARNESMKLIPEDTDICICTDIDEVFELGWRKLFDKFWTDDTKQASYRYTWNFNPDGTEGHVFYAEKAHCRKGFIWQHPVHEILRYTGDDAYIKKVIPGVQLSHFADENKPRSQYLPLLEMSVEEDPLNDRNMHYLGREYMFYRQWDKCIETLKKHLEMPRAVWRDERCASMRFIAKALIAKGNDAEACEWLYRAVAEAPYLREPYIDTANLMYKLQNWQGVIFFCEEALKIKEKTLSYICEPMAWGSRPYDLLSIAYYQCKNYEKSLENVRVAQNIEPTNSRITENVIVIEKLCRK